jgi:glyoxylase I family protein
MINSVIHHLGIGLRDPKVAEPFFDCLFVEFLGLEKEVMTADEAVAGWKGRGARVYLYPISSGGESGPVPGSLQHLAFSARTRAEVERFAEWAPARQVRIVTGPNEYPEYGRDYYAVFFAGPEDLRFELMHLTELDGATPL